VKKKKAQDHRLLRGKYRHVYQERVGSQKKKGKKGMLSDAMGNKGGSGGGGEPEKKGKKVKNYMSGRLVKNVRTAGARK